MADPWRQLLRQGRQPDGDLVRPVNAGGEVGLRGHGQPRLLDAREPRGAAADDDYGNGKMQYYAMDSAFAYNNSNNNNSSSSSKVEEDDEEVFDFSVDPDDLPERPVEKIPAVANAVRYHTVATWASSATRKCTPSSSHSVPPRSLPMDGRRR